MTLFMFCIYVALIPLVLSVCKIAGMDDEFIMGIELSEMLNKEEK